MFPCSDRQSLATEAISLLCGGRCRVDRLALAAPGSFVDLDSLGRGFEYGKLLGLAEGVEVFELHRDFPSDALWLRYLINSVVITIPAVFCAIALATLGGYALAKFRFRGNLLMFCIFVGGNFVPFQILMVPVRTMTLRFGLLDTYWALILFHLAFQTGFCTLFMRNFISTLPNALIESARVEGVNELKIFWYIIVPLLRPALAALAVLLFTFVWNDYFWALVLVQSDTVKPITTGIASLRGQWLASWQLISAGSVVAALPPVAMFFILQRQFIAGSRSEP